MLPYHKALALHQERQNRYQAEANRSAGRKLGLALFSSVSRVAGRVLDKLSKKSEVRPAV